jgi:hypothetical protein
MNDLSLRLGALDQLPFTAISEIRISPERVEDARERACGSMRASNPQLIPAKCTFCPWSSAS